MVGLLPALSRPRRRRTTIPRWPGGLLQLVRRQASRFPSPDHGIGRAIPLYATSTPFWRTSSARRLLSSAPRHALRLRYAAGLAEDAWTPLQHERMAAVCQTTGRLDISPRLTTPRPPTPPAEAWQLSHRSPTRSLRPDNRSIITPHNPPQIENRREFLRDFLAVKSRFRAEWPAPLPLPHPTRGVRRGWERFSRGNFESVSLANVGLGERGYGVLSLGIGMVAPELRGGSVEVDAPAHSARGASAGPGGSRYGETSGSRSAGTPRMGRSVYRWDHPEPTW